MLKILHSSDWHFGQSLYGYDRRDEHQYALSRLCAVVESKRPDVLLLCGDIFDTGQPSARSQRDLVEGLLSLRSAYSGMRIIAIAGNHDSGVGHESHRCLWQSVGCEMVGVMTSRSDVADYIFEINGKGFVCAVPYSPERNRRDGFFRDLADEVAVRNGSGLPVVLCSHLTVTGCDSRGHQEVGRLIGGIEGVSFESICQGYDYVALGHIHKFQRFESGGSYGSYCGSLIPVSFEEDYAHGVNYVEIDTRGGDVMIERIELEELRSVVSIPRIGAGVDEALKALEDYDGRIGNYVRVMVRSDGYVGSEVQDSARRICEEKGLRFCQLCVKRGDDSDGRRGRGLSVSEFQSSTPLDIARRYYEDTGLGYDDETEEMLEELMREVCDED